MGEPPEHDNKGRHCEADDRPGRATRGDPPTGPPRGLGVDSGLRQKRTIHNVVTEAKGIADERAKRPANCHSDVNGHGDLLPSSVSIFHPLLPHLRSKPNLANRPAKCRLGRADGKRHPHATAGPTTEPRCCHPPHRRGHPAPPRQSAHRRQHHRSACRCQPHRAGCRRRRRRQPQSRWPTSPRRR